MSMADGRGSGDSKPDASGTSTYPSPDPQNGSITILPQGQDPENPQSPDASPPGRRQSIAEATLGYFLHFSVLGMPFLLPAIIPVLAISLIGWSGVFTPPVTIAMILVVVVTYAIIDTVSQLSARRNKNQRYKKFATIVALSMTMVALVLQLSLLVSLFVISQGHSGLKSRMMAGLETTKWIEIALASSGVCIIWYASRLTLALVKIRYDRYDDDIVYITDKSVGVITCVCFIFGETLVSRGVLATENSATFYGLDSRIFITSIISPLLVWYTGHALARLCLVWFVRMQNVFQKLNCRKKKEEHTSTPVLALLKYGVFMTKGLWTKIMILSVVSVVLHSWISSVRPGLPLQKASGDVKRALDFVTPTIITLLIGAMLLLVKEFLLLLWEARELYKRFTKKIFHGFVQLYFLAKFGGSGWDIFGLERDGGDKRSVWSPIQDVDQRPVLMSPRDQESEERKKRKKMQDEAKLRQILQTATDNFICYDILKSIVNFLLEAEQHLASNKIEKLIVQWKGLHRQEDVEDRTMTQAILVESIKLVYQCKLEPDDSKLLHDLLEADLDTERDVQYDDFENWMKKAHKDCRQLGNTFAGTLEVVDYLNKIMMGFITAVSIVIWLFLTKIATIELIILLASPLLAATFIFGETARTVFQGLIFAVVVHPFDVGDICVIEGNELEVKKIRIWKTAFYKNGCKDEEVLYPNSLLINAPIIKQESNLDLHDSVEFNVQLNLKNYTTEDEAINTLTEKITEYLKNDKNIESSYHCVSIKEIEETIKMEVRFRHMKYFRYMAHSECLMRKDETRSKLLLAIRKFIDDVRREFMEKTTSQCDNDIWI